MKIGDKVRFLSDVGGGIITGFQHGGKIVLVEDEDGFDIPVLASEVVVITTDQYNFPKPAAQPEAPKPTPSAMGVKPTAKPMPEPRTDEDEEIDPADKEITYKPKPEERNDGDRLSVYLAFVPTDIKGFSKSDFECYLVNDCNYFIHYAYLSKENGSCTLRSQGTVEPNTKIYLEDINHARLNEIERVVFQLFAYKEDKPFLPKPAISTDLRIDTTKFFKFHTFHESMFFDDPTLEIAIVKDDEVTRQTAINAQALEEAMREKNNAEKEMHRPARISKKSNVKDIIEVDLHANALLETTAGMSAGDIKEYQLGVFRRTLQEHIHDKGRRIVFIHGKGEGALRTALLDELKRKYKNCTFQDASFQQYGFGATMVIVH